MEQDEWTSQEFQSIEYNNNREQFSFVAIKNYVHNKTTLMLTISYAKEANNKKKLDKNTNNNM